MDEKEKGFVVKDRRMFSQDGPTAADEKPAPEERAEPKSESASSDQVPNAEIPLPQINFPTFVASLNASASGAPGVIETRSPARPRKTCPWPSRPSTY